MSSVVLNGDSSGSVTLTVPSAAGSNTATVPAQTGTLEMLGQGTAVSASGTSVDFTSIPSWVKRITVIFGGVSTNGTSTYQVQLGAGSLTTTGYVGVYGLASNAAASTVGSITTGFPIFSNAAADILTGSLIITNISGNSWISQGVINNSGGTVYYSTSAGSIALSGTLDRIRITTVNGTDTFDAGTINILYEG